MAWIGLLVSISQSADFLSSGSIVRGEVGNLFPLLCRMAVAADGPRREPFHERRDRSREKDYDINQREELTHVLGAAADEQRPVS